MTTTRRGGATMPFSTAVSKSASIGLMPMKFIATPIRVASTMTA